MNLGVSPLKQWRELNSIVDLCEIVFVLFKYKHRLFLDCWKWKNLNFPTRSYVGKISLIGRFELNTGSNASCAKITFLAFLCKFHFQKFKWNQRKLQLDLVQIFRMIFFHANSQIFDHIKKKFTHVGEI